jgi:hypothetical protein
MLPGQSDALGPVRTAREDQIEAAEPGYNGGDFDSEAALGPFAAM